MSTEPRCSVSSRGGAVGIVASAGGIPALIELLPRLASNYPAPIFIAQHLARSVPSVLPAVLNWHCGVEAIWAANGTAPKAGRIYLVPPAHEMEVSRERLCLRALGRAPAAWLSSADVLLHSLSRAYGAQAVGVVLSGMLPAGISGMRAIHAAGGTTIAQHGLGAMYLEMPSAAADLAKAQLVLSPSNIAEALNIIANVEGCVAGFISARDDKL
jgi:chemotaxis response regulator CheB